MIGSENVNVRIATSVDMPAVLELIIELAIYENAKSEVKNSVAQLTEDGFGSQPAFECLVAEFENEIIGFALFFTSYSTWRGKCLYLEDLCVKEKFRRLGIGKKLFDTIHKLAIDRSMKRLSWQVLEWNTPAIEFYKKYKANFDSEWVNCKIGLD